MDFAIRQRSHTSVIDLPEQFDFTCRDAFAEVLHALKRDPKKHLVLNLERVTAFDGVAVGLVMVAHYLFTDIGRRVFLVRPQGLVKNILEQLDLPSVIPVRDSEDEACFESAIVSAMEEAHQSPANG